MSDVRYFYGAAIEEFPPDDLLQQAMEAQRAGFEGIGVSDHFQPWFTPGHSAHAWVWLGALGQATKEIPIGTAVTPPGARHHPAVIAQAFATLEWMNPGRAYLGFGSGESLNETPVGDTWPSPDDQVDRMEEALEIIRALWDGDHVTREGRFFTVKDAYIHTLPERKPPIYVSAFAPKAAGVAARLGDGLWTLADPEQAPDVIDAYKSACDDAGKEPGEIILHHMFSWAEDDDVAFEQAQHWRATAPPEFYTEDWHDPDAMQKHAQENISDDDFRESGAITSDLDVHIDKIREVEKKGATIIPCMNLSTRDPHAAIEKYREKVLPR